MSATLATVVIPVVPSTPRIPEPYPGQSPRSRRDQLRSEVIRRGGEPVAIETVRGDCPLQMDEQIDELRAWLDVHP